MASTYVCSVGHRREIHFVSCVQLRGNLLYMVQRKLLTLTVLVTTIVALGHIEIG